MSLTLPQIARALGGEVTGGQVLAPGPGHSREDRSLCIRLSAGAEHGFVVHSHSNDDWAACRDHVAGKLGIRWLPDTGTRLRTETRRGVSSAPAEGADANKAAALRIWNQALDPVGTVVETYLASRGLDLPPAVAGEVIRFHPSCPFGKGQRHPCMIALFRSIETGEPVAIHRTALTPDGRKIDRKMLGPVAGAAIMLDQLDPERGSLTAGEGIESAMSARAMGFTPAWALGSADAIGKLAPIDGVDTLILLGEHDDKRTNQKVTRQCGTHWAAAGREVFVAAPKAGLGKDANDALRNGPQDAAVLDVRLFEAGDAGVDELDLDDCDGGDGEEPRAVIRATPFVWVNPATIPPREWLYGEHYIRQFVSTTVSPGAVGKSSLVIAEALAMASGKPLLGPIPKGRLKVWLWNGEDPLQELERRVMATAVHYGLTPDDIAGRLFIDSGRSTEIVIAEEMRSGFSIVRPVVEEVRATIIGSKIDVVIIDPFVSSHRVSENDNNAIDRVAKAWAQIADDCRCSVELVHHSRKTNGAEVTVEDARGASALIAAARSARALNPMTEDEAGRAGVEHSRRRHFRVDNGKANMAPPPEGSTWLFLASVHLGNSNLLKGGSSPGDSIGVVEPWQWPAPLDGVSVADLRKAQDAVSNGRWRENVQAKDWVGIPIAVALGLDTGSKAHKAKVRQLLQIWLANGMFVVVEGLDEARRTRSFVEVGERAAD